jgi:hypothetical protein
MAALYVERRHDIKEFLVGFYEFYIFDKVDFDSQRPCRECPTVEKDFIVLVYVFELSDNI